MYDQELIQIFSNVEMANAELTLTRDDASYVSDENRWHCVIRWVGKDPETADAMELTVRKYSSTGNEALVGAWKQFAKRAQAGVPVGGLLSAPTDTSKYVGYPEYDDSPVEMSTEEALEHQRVEESLDKLCSKDEIPF